MQTTRLLMFNPTRCTAALVLVGFALFGATAQAQTSNPDDKALDVPTGRYVLDRDHSNLQFSVQHLGLSNYVMRFTQYNVELNIRPDELGKSSVAVTMDPNSVAVDYYSDYAETHPDAEYDSWTETLAKSDKFFNAGTYPEITFQSTSVEQTGPGKIRLTGDLTMLGQTHPVTLDAKVTGATQSHPTASTPAVAFSATGRFDRSQFGMDYLIQPPLVSDEVTLNFDGEFLHAGDQAGAES